MPVAVITDSTANLPAGCADVPVVPLRVLVGSRSVCDGQLTAPELVAALRARGAVSTSRPSPAQFSDAYRAALDSGAEHVVSIHISAALSGTWDAAVLAAQDFPHGVVRVVDSRSAAAALGFAVRAASECARSGGTVAQVQNAAVGMVDRIHTYFYVDTLEYLRRGGRIGAAQALLGTTLAIKPLLQIVDGKIVPLEKARTASRALARLADLTLSTAGEGLVDVAVAHFAADERAAALAQLLRESVPQLRELQVCELGPVLGAHLGPGALGTIIAPV